MLKTKKTFHSLKAELPVSDLFDTCSQCLFLPMLAAEYSLFDHNSYEFSSLSSAMIAVFVWLGLGTILTSH